MLVLPQYMENSRSEFAETAPYYATYRPGIPVAADRQVSQTVAGKQHPVLLDLGSGTGHVPAALHTAFAEIDVVERDPGMLEEADEERARALLTEQGNKRVLSRRGMIPDELLRPAAHLVDAWMREHYDPARLIAYTNQTFAPDLGGHPDLLGLFHDSGLRELVTQLLYPAPVTSAQIQIRLPDSAEQPVKAMHVDGVSCPHLHPEDLDTFTLIAGVVLSGIPPATPAPRTVCPAGTSA